MPPTAPAAIPAGGAEPAVEPHAMVARHARSLGQRYVRLLALLAVPFLLLLVGLAAYQLRSQRQAQLEVLAQAAHEQRLALDGAIGPLRDHVEILRRMAVDRLGGPEPATASPLRGLLRPVALQGGPSPLQGLGLDHLAQGPLAARLGNVMADPLLLDRPPPAMAEVEMALGLFEPMRLHHQVNPRLTWSYYLSARGDLVTLYPFVPLAGLAGPGTASMRERIGAWLAHEVFAAGTPERNPQGAAYWTGAYEDEAGKGWIVSHAAPVHEDGRFVGVVGSDLDLGFLGRFLAGLSPPAGRAWIVNDRGEVLAGHGLDVAGAERVPRLGELVAEPLRALPVAELLRPGRGLRHAHGHWLVAQRLETAPFTLLYTVADATLGGLILPRLLPTGLAVLGFLLLLAAAQIVLQRAFVRPALALVRQIQAEVRGEPADPPPVPALWRPWLDAVRDAFAQRRAYEAELARSEARFKAAAESMPDGLVIFDAQDRIAFYNSRYPEHLPPALRAVLRLGVRFEDWIREGLARGPIYHPDMGEDFAQRRLVMRREGRAEHEHKVADGRWMRLRERPMPDGGRVLLTTDVSTARRQRQALAAQTRKLEAVLANIAEGVSIVDGEGRVVLVNDGFLRFYGFPKALAAPGTPLAAFVEHRLARGELRPEERDGTDRAGLVLRRVQALLAAGTMSFEETTTDGRTVLVRRERLPDGLLVSSYVDISELKRRERENALLATAIEQVGDSVEIAGPDHRLLYVNPAFTRLTGWTRAEALGRTPAELLHGDRRDAGIEAAIAAGRTWQGRLTSRHKEGHLLFQEATISPLRDPAGALSHSVAVKRDIGERIRAEEALKESEARYRAVVEGQTEFILRLKPDGTLTFVNDAYCRYRGLPRAVLLAGFDDIAHYPPEERARIHAAWAGLTPERPRATYQLEEPRGAAGVRHEEWTDTGIFDAEGRLVEIQAVGRDITERVRALAELAASEQRFRAIAESHPTPMMIARLADRRAMFANEAFLATFKLTARDLRTLDRDRLYADPAQRRAMFEALADGRPVEHKEIGLRRADGAPFPAVLTARAISYEGEACAVVSFQDLSVLKSAEAEIARQREALYQSEKLTALGSLLAGVAHELNNPLSVVTGYAEMLRDTAPDAAFRARAERVHAAAERCARIVKTFLAMARQKPPQRGLVDLPRAIEGALELAAYGLRTAGVAVTVELPPALPPVWGDADQLHQVFVNLVVNAQQALTLIAPPRRLAIRARAGRGEVLVELADNGPGIPPELRTRIFEPFFTTKPQGVGTGIGLSVCHGIVTAHGGRIEVEGGEGAGTLFRLALPVAEGAQGRPAGAVPAPGPGAAGDPPAGACRGRALVVDDEREIAELVAETLAALGLEVLTAASGRQALALLAGQGADLVVSDIRMPDLDGPALIEALRREHPGLARRLILITGDALGAGTNAVVQGEGLTILEKPLDLAALRREARRLLETRGGAGPEGAA